ncbi:MAG TPA: flagellar basal body protein [Glaciihabitans sp.]|nr:flagellar basal body protein [Glaciihabitans sp.]
MFDSVSAVALTSALDGLAARQRMIANNIANINTPNYRAQSVQFENALAASVADGDGRVSATTRTSTDPVNSEGNNVNLDSETLANIDTVLRFQFATQAVGGQFTSMRTAMRTN